MSEIPAVDTAEAAAPRGAAGFEGLHPNARWPMRGGAVFLATVLALAGGIPIAVKWGLGLGPGAALVLAMWLLYAGLALAHAGARFRRTRYRLDRDGLTIRRGVFWHTETRVPRSRVQHVDLNHGPIDRRLGLAELKVYTAGTRLASVALGGLDAARAEALRDAMVGDERA
ncbi:MAG TPA: PH domain-containing protein [Xanthomonadaceae bacterium]|nr:PH domain-containing protein [Xanthomonadaceae bacterium]